MTTFKDKMFREKPYTQCFDCIQGHALKCKSCVNLLVKNIIKEKESAASTPAPSTQRKTTTLFKTVQLPRPRRKEEWQIHTKYGAWMERLKQKDSVHNRSLNLGRWPLKSVGKQVLVLA
jgi:hypothetical protein